MIKSLTIHISTIFCTFYKSLTNIYTNLLNLMHIQTSHLHILTLAHTHTQSLSFVPKKKKKKKLNTHTTHPITNLQIILSKI